MKGGLRLLENADEGVLYNDMNACHIYNGGDEAAKNISCPTLSIMGERDMMTPLKLARVTASKIKNSREVIIPGVGHIMQDEAPDAVLDALRDFLLVTD